MTHENKDNEVAAKALANDERVQRSLEGYEKGIDGYYKSLSSYEREELRAIMHNLLKGDQAAVEALYAVDYDHRRVDPETFFTHPDYMGHFWPEIYPAWQTHVLNICNPLNGIVEVILTGGIGLGKSTISCVVGTYFLHKVLCLKDPAKFYDLGKNSKIVFGLYSISLEAAEETGFYILRDQMLADSPFFNDVYPRKPQGVDVIKFPKSVSVVVGSQAVHAAGRNLFFISVDEMNLMKKGAKTAGKAFELANHVKRRLESRFLQSGGDVPGCVVFIGSSASDTAFTSRRAHQVRHLPSVYVVEGAKWEFVSEKQLKRYSGKKFRVQIGGDMSDSRVLDNVIPSEYGKFDGNSVVEEADDPDPDGEIIWVPVEHYVSFDLDVLGALQDIAGRSTKSFSKLFANRVKVVSCQDESLPKAFSQEILAAYLGSAIEPAVAFDREKMCKTSMGNFIPRRHPGAPRYVHIDLAKNQDRAGVAMCHPSSHFVSQEDVESDPDGIGVYDIHKDVELDFAVTITAGPRKEPIDYAKIRRLIFTLRQLGFWIRWVTLDSYQSEDSRQRFIEARMKSKILSVDKKSMPYKVFRNAVYGGKFKMPVNRLLFEEMVNLDYDAFNDRVDHPVDFTKDCSDAVAGCTYMCLVDKVSPSEAFKEQKERENLDGYLYTNYLSSMEELFTIVDD